MKKISHDGNIDNEYQNFNRSRMAVYLVDLEGDERTCDDDGKPLSPTFYQPETYPLSEEQSRVNEAAKSKIPDLIRTKVSPLLKDAINVLVAWIQAKHRDPTFQRAGHVLVKQPESAHTNRDQKNRFYQLE